MPKVKTNNVPRGMGRIIPNATGSYTFRWWDKGQHEETFSTRKLAEDKQAQVYRDKRAGEQTFTDKSRSAIPFVIYCGEWIASRRAV